MPLTRNTLYEFALISSRLSVDYEKRGAIALERFDKTRRADPMPENMRATPPDSPAPYDARLILNESAAVVFAPPSEARSLYEQFRKKWIALLAFARSLRPRCYRLRQPLRRSGETHPHGVRFVAERRGSVRRIVPLVRLAVHACRRHLDRMAAVLLVMPSG